MNDETVGAEGAKISGEGEYKEPEKAEVNEEEIVELKDNQGNEEESTQVIDQGMETKEGSEAVEYDAGGTDAMEELAKDNEDSIAVPDNQDTEIEPDEIKGLDELVEDDTELENEDNKLEPEVPDATFVDTAVLTESNKDGFNPGVKQDARYDSAIEGGIAKPQTTGKDMDGRHLAVEGSQIRHADKPDDIKGKFEMSGFSVSYEETPGQGLISVDIYDYFNDIETAQASVNGDKYLMPIADGGFKVVNISSGAPRISHDDREIYKYLNDKNMWTRA